MSGKWHRLMIVCIIYLFVFLLPGGCSAQKKQLIMQSSGILLEEQIKGPEMETETAEEILNSYAQETEPETLIALVTVHVCGAVEKAGIYELADGSRIWDAVEAAGGVTEDGALDYLNLAALLTDGQKVVVPFLSDVEHPWGEEETISSSGNTVSTADEGKININTATREQLMTLTGIGEAKARAIIEYRESTGYFSSVEEIMNVSGIKEGAYAKIKDQITVTQ